MLKKHEEDIEKLLSNNDKNGFVFGSIRKEMGKLINQYLAVFRDETGMQTALEKLSELKLKYKNIIVPDKGRVFNTALIFTLELGFMLDCAETIAISALERKESRGAHARTDMPDRDDKNWMKHTVMWLDYKNQSTLGYRDVTLTTLTNEVEPIAPIARVY